MRREIFRTLDVRVEGGEVQRCYCATCQRSSYTKIEYSLFYQKFDAEYFFIQQFFWKKSGIFGENLKKLFCGRIWQLFKERRRLTPKINVTFFITNEVSNNLLCINFFQKMCYVLRKRQKTVSGAQVPFEGKEASRNENEYPMVKNFQNRHTTVAFFMWSLPILTLTGVKKTILRQF